MFIGLFTLEMLLKVYGLGLHAYFRSSFNKFDFTVSNPAARFTKYLTIILRLPYGNANVTFDLRRTSNIHPTKNARLFPGTIHLQYRGD